MTSISEKGGASFKGLRLLLCENPLPPLDEAIAAAQVELPNSNYYTEAYSGPLRRRLAETLKLPERLIHVNAGSELILRQLFERFGQRAHLIAPTYELFPQIARHYTETRLQSEREFHFDLEELRVPDGTTLVVVVNPNNPTGLAVNMDALPGLLRHYPETRFLVDEAFIGLGGASVACLVPQYTNLIVTRTFSKAHSLAGFRVGYAISPPDVSDDLNDHNDAYPLARPSQAAAIATLQHEDKIITRSLTLRGWAKELAVELRAMGIRTFPSDTYFFLADLSPHNAADVAQRLAGLGILVKPLKDDRLGSGFMRITTAIPDQNARFLSVLRKILGRK